MTLRLASDTSVTGKIRVVGDHYTLNDAQYDDNFIVMDIDEKVDVILGLPWIDTFEP